MGDTPPEELLEANAERLGGGAEGYSASEDPPPKVLLEAKGTAERLVGAAEEHSVSKDGGQD